MTEGHRKKKGLDQIYMSFLREQGEHSFMFHKKEKHQ